MDQKWTSENLRKLYAAMKSNLPEECKTFPYRKTQKELDWSTVAFPPFSAEECQEKWGEILKKMRKFRSLTELIDEAECVRSDIQQQSEAVGKWFGEPKRPSGSANAIFIKYQMALLKEKVPNAKKRFIKASQCWKDVTKEEKKFYYNKVQKNLLKYLLDFHEWFKTLTAEEQNGYKTAYPRKYKYIEDLQRSNQMMEEQNKHKMEEQNNYKRQQLCLNRPSDSEDEDIEDSSSNEEEDDLDSDEDEEADGGGITFEMY